MADAAAQLLGRRGPDLLLAHCSALTGAVDGRPSAYDRLQHALGNELAHMLVSALVDRRTRPARLAA